MTTDIEKDVDRMLTCVCVCLGIGFFMCMLLWDMRCHFTAPPKVPTAPAGFAGAHVYRPDKGRVICKDILYVVKSLPVDPLVVEMGESSYLPSQGKLLWGYRDAGFVVNGSTRLPIANPIVEARQAILSGSWCYKAERGVWWGNTVGVSISGPIRCVVRLKAPLELKDNMAKNAVTAYLVISYAGTRDACTFGNSDETLQRNFQLMQVDEAVFNAVAEHQNGVEALVKYRKAASWPLYKQATAVLMCLTMIVGYVTYTVIKSRRSKC